MDKKTVIIGAGPAGLAAAWNLIKSGRKVAVVDISDACGGLSRTFEWNGLKLDYGPHSFHVKEERLTALFKELCYNDYVEVPSVIVAQLFVMGKFLSYPLKLREAVLKLNPLFVAKMLSDYFYANAKRLFVQEKEDSFEAWGKKRFGRCLYDLAFGTYSQKVWGISTAKLSHKLAQQKLPDINIIDILIEMLGGKGARQKQFYSAYLYPRNGIGQIFDTVAQKISDSGSLLFRNCEAVKIEINNARACRVTIKNHKTKELATIDCDSIVSSIPVNDLVPAFSPLPAQQIIMASGSFKYRSLILVYLLLETPQMTDKLMYYLIDKKFKFHRISELKNLKTGLIPDDKTVVCMEICCNEADEAWSMPDDSLYKLAVDDLMSLGLVGKRPSGAYHVKRLKNAYPVFDLNYDHRLSEVFSFLHSINNLYLIGRQGLFLNNDIHDSMEMGLLATDCLLKENSNKSWNKINDKFLNAGFQGKK